jgi:apolipoprotein D and lipocalin family protein
MKLLRWRLSFGVIALSLLSGCVSAPDGVEPVEGFDIHRYLGRWYEIARLDHSFERGLQQVTADYSLRDDGCIRVLNQGVDAESGERKQAEGRGCFVASPDVGHLKVSFFGPFYGAYVVFALDQEGYSHALVAGPDRDYLWLLARTPALEKDVVDRLVAKAASLGFATDRLIFVEHQGS